MKKVALVFVVAVLVPSLVLAWLALRSQRDLQFLFERQQSLLYQRVTDALATDIASRLAQQQQEFSAQVETLAAGKDAREVAAQFDSQLRQSWLLAEVGFCVALSGKILSPAATARDETKTFYTDNSGFLGNRETAEVYRTQRQCRRSTWEIITGTMVVLTRTNCLRQNNFSGVTEQKQSQQALAFANLSAPDVAQSPARERRRSRRRRAPAAKYFQLQIGSHARKVNPQNNLDVQNDSAAAAENNISRVIPAEADFAQLIGDGTDGMLARFLQNKLKLMCWHRLGRNRI